jgi:hypothetical protein
MQQLQFQAKIVTNRFYKALSQAGLVGGTPTGILRGVHHVAKNDAVVLLHAFFPIKCYWHYKKEGQSYIYLRTKIMYFEIMKKTNCKNMRFLGDSGYPDVTGLIMHVMHVLHCPDVEL